MRLASFLAVTGLCLTISCAEEGGTSRGDDPEITDDGGLVVEPDPMTNCPGSPPKVGENCGPEITDSNRCEFSLGDCTAPNGAVFTETQTYCCKQGVWETCGSKNPCAVPEVDAAEPVSPVTPDAGVAPDVAPDLLPDAAGAD